MAQASLDAKTTGAVTSTIMDNKGGKHQIHIARIPLIIKVTYFNATDTKVKKSSLIPESIQSAADAVAHKHASPLAIILSFLLLVIGVVMGGVAINSATRMVLRPSPDSP